MASNLTTHASDFLFIFIFRMSVCQIFVVQTNKWSHPKLLVKLRAIVSYCDSVCAAVGAEMTRFTFKMA